MYADFVCICTDLKIHKNFINTFPKQNAFKIEFQEKSELYVEPSNKVYLFTIVIYFNEEHRCVFVVSPEMFFFLKGRLPISDRGLFLLCLKGCLQSL